MGHPPPDAGYDLTVTETDTGVNVTGFATSYPNVEVWQYSDSGPPTQVFNSTTQSGPFTGPRSLLLPTSFGPLSPQDTFIAPH